MSDSAVFALFLVGLLGGTHCVGMCGGIVGALSLNASARPMLHLAYNGGRISSYVLAGALAGLLGGWSQTLASPFVSQLHLRIGLYTLASLMLVALGLYLMGETRSLRWIENAGQRLWRRLQPLTRHFLPVHSPAQAWPLGMLWGWLPCGLVYSALATALTSAAPLQGALLMLAFGLGTLPNLLLAGLLLTRYRELTRLRAVRLASGLMVAGYGVWGLVAAWRLSLSL